MEVQDLAKWYVVPVPPVSCRVVFFMNMCVTHPTSFPRTLRYNQPEHEGPGR